MILISDWEIQEAINNQWPIRLTYRKKVPSGGMQETRRVVEPYEFIKTQGGHFLIRGMDRKTRDVRAFRTDRVFGYKIMKSGRFVVEV